MFKIFFISVITSFAMAQTYIKGPALIEGITITATAAGTTTLTNTSQTNQQFTGVTTQTVVLPDATTLPIGKYYQLQNRSTGIVTVQTSGGGALTSIYPGTQKQVLVTNVGSAAGTWDVAAVSVTDVVGVLPLINGGTNKAMTASAGAIVYSDADSFELDGTHLFWDASNRQLLVNSDGSNFTAAPNNTTLHTIGHNGSTSRIVFDSHNSGVDGSYLLGRHARGTAAAPSAVLSGDTLMGFAGVGYGTTGYASNGSGYILIRASETFTDTSNATNMQFFTTPTASITPVQRMNVSSDGHVSIGTGAPAASAKLDIQGTDGALVIPRMTTAQKNALTATAGMTVYDTTLARFECYTSAWGTCGNALSPTIQKFTTGSGTYTTPSGVKYIRVRLVGGGGGGGGSGVSGTAGQGGTGGDTTFGTLLVRASGGIGGYFSQGNAPSGGTGVIYAPAIGSVMTGGGGSQGDSDIKTYSQGGAGGNSAFGGGGGGMVLSVGASNAAINSGSGGGGAGSGTVAANCGNGGGAGGFADAIINSPSSSYSYSIGSGGAGGTAGTSGYAGGAGGSGYIEVTEYYQ